MEQKIAFIIASIGLVMGLYGCDAGTKEKSTSASASSSDTAAPASTTLPGTAITAVPSMSYLINGTKLIGNGRPLVKGSKVQDMSVNQEAILTGTFVVIETETSAAVLARANFTVVQKLADSTYEVRPVDADADLFAAYTELKDMPVFSAVEMQLEYLAVNDRPTF